MNQPVKVKFCGMKTVKDLETCKMADFLGFIVGVPTSKRNLSIEKTKLLVSNIVEDKKSVVVTRDLGIVKTISKEIQPDVIQIHTKVDDLDALLDIFEKEQQGYALTIGCSDKEIINGQILTHDIATHSEYIIVDSIAGKNISGGSGIARNYLRTAEIISKYPNLNFLVAGGLKSTNILQILDETHPYGVDVSSGIENAEGRKDQNLVNEFVNKVNLFNREDYNA